MNIPGHENEYRINLLNLMILKRW